jgi:hypothetical protein
MSFCQYDKVYLPELDKYQIILILRHLQQTQLNAHKKQPQRTNCNWPLKGRQASEE